MCSVANTSDTSVIRNNCLTQLIEAEYLDSYDLAFPMSPLFTVMLCISSRHKLL